jgi:hypothetical protein
LDGHQHHQRAGSPKCAISLDWQRNDRLGRQQYLPAFQYRRQILRRCIESDTHANTFSHSNRDSYADGDCNSNAERYCKTQSSGAASPDACATSVVRPSSKTLVEDLVVTQRLERVQIGAVPWVRNSIKRRGFFFHFSRRLPKLARARQNGQHHRSERTAD